MEQRDYAFERSVTITLTLALTDFELRELNQELQEIEHSARPNLSALKSILQGVTSDMDNPSL